MEQLNSIAIDHIGLDTRELTFNSGQLISDPSGVSADYLMISCLPGYYNPRQGGLVAELYEAGVDIEELQRTCEADFRPLLPCWIATLKPGLSFRRLVVYEASEDPEESARNAWQPFQALRTFVGLDTTASLAMGVPNIHYENSDSLLMLRMVVFAAASLAARASWSTISIVVPEASAESLAPAFQTFKERYINPPSDPEAMVDEIEQVKRLFPSVRENRDREEMRKRAGLTRRQFLAIFYYTYHSYSSLNRVLRSGDITSPEYSWWQATLEAISTGLAQMKRLRAADTTVYRNLREFPGLDTIYFVGNVVREAAFTSTTRIQYWSGGIGDGGEYTMVIGSATGKDISSISAYSLEEEVLFDFGMQHIVYRINDYEIGIPRRDIEILSHQLLPNTTDIQFTHLGTA